MSANGKTGKKNENPIDPNTRVGYVHMGQGDETPERAGVVAFVVAFKGEPVTLLGKIRKVGDKARDFTVVKNDMTPTKLSDYIGKKILISVVPSLDTGVCDLQTKRFNTEASNLPNVQILTISMDLPFAQARWCGAAGVKNLLILSDYREADFGLRYGLLIKELRLLARAVIVIDEKGTITYQEIVPEVTNHPDYEAALAAVR